MIRTRSWDRERPRLREIHKCLWSALDSGNWDSTLLFKPNFHPPPIPHLVSNNKSYCLYIWGALYPILCYHNLANFPVLMGLDLFPYPFLGTDIFPEPLAGAWRGRVEQWLETDFCPPWILNTIRSRMSLLLLSGTLLANPQLSSLALCWACHLWPVLEESSALAFHRTRCFMCWTNLLPPAAVSPSEWIRL